MSTEAGFEVSEVKENLQEKKISLEIPNTFL